jgi:endonuclease/exonuclease/phosphatase family metal-dependent hydrolase
MQEWKFKKLQNFKAKQVSLNSNFPSSFPILMIDFCFLTSKFSKFSKFRIFL